MADLHDEIIAEFVARRPHPRLGGRTPREAALDPIGRHELERLLESSGGSPGPVSAARLRHAIDL